MIQIKGSVARLSALWRIRQVTTRRLLVLVFLRLGSQRFHHCFLWDTDDEYGQRQLRGPG